MNFPEHLFHHVCRRCRTYQRRCTYRIFNYKCAQYGLERLRRGRKKKLTGVVLLDDNES